MSAEQIAGVHYRCKECGWNFGDPQEARGFGIWAGSARAHMINKHSIFVDKPVSHYVTAFFIWTTPTGKEVVTMGMGIPAGSTISRHRQRYGGAV